MKYQEQDGEIVTYEKVEDVDYDFKEYDAEKGEFIDDGKEGEVV